MRKIIIWLATTYLCLVIVLTSCTNETDHTHSSVSEHTGMNPPAGSQPSDLMQSHGGEINDHVSFVDTLRSATLNVDIVGDIKQPFLRARGTLLRISGGNLSQVAEIQSYNYDDTDLGMDGLQAVQEDINQIKSNGDPVNTSVNWNAPPHWFHRGRVIVLYTGTDKDVIVLLTKMLGPQFAGQ